MNIRKLSLFLPTHKSNMKKPLSIAILGGLLLTGCGGYSSDAPNNEGNQGANNGIESGNSINENPQNAEENNNKTLTLPSRSSTIAITSDDKKIVVVNRQNNSVSIIEVRDDSGTDQHHKIAEVIVGKEPRYVVISPDDRHAFVTNTVDGTVSMIDIATETPHIVGSPITVGTEPRGIAITPNGAYVYVANHTEGSISVIDPKQHRVINTIEVGGNPMALAITNDGDLSDEDELIYVTQFFSTVTDGDARPDGFDDAKKGVVNYFNVSDSLTNSTTIDKHFINPVQNSGFTADRRQFCAKTREILQDNNEILFFNSGVDGTGNGAAALAKDTFCPDTNSEDATADGAIGKTAQGVYPNYLYGAVLRNDYLYIPNVGAAPEPPVKFNVNVQALVSAIDTQTGADFTTNLNNQIKTEVQPLEPTTSLDRLFGNDIVAIDADAAGKDFLILSRGGNYVLRATANSFNTLDIGAPHNVVRFQTGNIPSGVVMSHDGTRAYTNNDVNTSVTAINLDNNTVLERDISASEPPIPGTQKHRNLVGKLSFFTALGIPDTHDTNHDGAFDIPLRDINPLASRGKASDNGWSSCSSCHEDGHSDNVTWIFPTGPRQTIALEGTFAKNNKDDQRILNWNGVRGSVTDFNNNSRGVQGGIGHATNVDGADLTTTIFNHGPTQGISDALDAMTDWVANSVRAPIMPDIATDETLANGRHTFTTYCSACHGGEKWTKSSIENYTNNPTFAANPLGANFFAAGKEPALDANLTVAGPQIRSLNLSGETITFLDDVGTFNIASPVQIRGAGALGGGVISKPGDPNEGVEVAKQSTQGFAPLGGIGFNTPSLLGVAYHAPYFHDGSALTLDAVFTRHRLPAESNKTIAEVINNNENLEDLRAFLNAIDDDTPIIE